jgi:2-oxoacid:acceptor oxidoreductase gamma subunit (pyruvate/2-ketoisovalerate family)/2-oxoacid:acceptor oxidoreductase delta subunit (pyruvate/2-ketoisovalerate family)
MRELLLVGRGGEGVVLASQILADTFARAGYWVQSFPEFKAERRGAPISAFLRWDADAPIHRRYKIRDCDVLAVVSPSPPPPELLARVRPGGLVVVNRESRLPVTGAFSVARVPASRIASERGVLSSEGRPMGNVAVLGACVRLLVPGGLPLLERAIRARLPEPCALAAADGYAGCTRQHAQRADPVVVRAPERAPAGRPQPLFPVSTTDSRGVATGSWSLDRPVLLDACNACALCALFCPEGAITRSGRTMIVDYLHCKGCGICQAVCPVRDAVALEPVPA